VSEIRILHLNVQSISKINQLKKLLEIEQPDIIVLTEHWLKKDEIDLYCLPNYARAAYYCREAKIGGGVSIFIKNGFGKDITNVSSIANLSKDTMEVASCRFNYNKNQWVVIGIYRPPGQDKQRLEDFMQQLEEVLIKTAASTSNRIIAGDFNIDRSKNGKEARNVLDLIKSNNFNHLFNGVTRDNKNGGTCIDYMFIDFNTFNLMTRNIQNVISDHNVQMVSFNMKSNGGGAQRKNV